MLLFSFITKNKFLRYELMRRSGRVNMWFHDTVSKMTGLGIDEIKKIQRNYGNYANRWLN